MFLLFISALENIKEGTALIHWDFSWRTKQKTKQISKSETWVRRKADCTAEILVTFSPISLLSWALSRSFFSKGKILQGDWITKIWWNIILKTNLPKKDFAEKSLREICFSHIRNSLRIFIGWRAISRPGENEKKIYIGKGRVKFDQTRDGSDQ